MICDHPQCTGKHGHVWRQKDLCPSAQDKSRAAWRRYYDSHRGQRIESAQLYRTTAGFMLAMVKSESKQRGKQ